MNISISILIGQLNNFGEYCRTKLMAFVASIQSHKDWSLDSMVNEHPIAVACVLICTITLLGNWLLNKKYPEEIRDKKNDYIIPIVALIFVYALISFSEEFWPLKSTFHALGILKIFKI